MLLDGRTVFSTVPAATSLSCTPRNTKARLGLRSSTGSKHSRRVTGFCPQARRGWSTSAPMSTTSAGKGHYVS